MTTTFNLPDGRSITFPTEDKSLAEKALKNYLKNEDTDNLKENTTVSNIISDDKEKNEFIADEVKNKSIQAAIKDSFNNRATFQAIGGAVGVVPSMIAGATVGSVVPGIGNIVGGITGGILGGLAGGQVYDVAQGLLTGETQSVPEQYKQLAKDVKNEVMFNVGGASVPGLGPAFNRLLGGATESAKKIYEAGVRTGVQQDLVTASDSALVQGYNRALGVFPLTGGPIRSAAQRRASSINQLANDTLNAFGPNASMVDLGVEMTRAAKESYAAFRRTSASLYDDFVKSTENLSNPNIFKLTNAKEAVKLIENSIKSPVASPRSDKVLEFLQEIKNINGKISPEQYRSLQSDINFLIRQGNVQGTDVRRLIKVKKGLEKDFSMPFVESDNLLGLLEEKQIADEILKAHAVANKFYAEGMYKFSSPVARKFKRVDKNIFSAGVEVPGSINPDELAKGVFRVGSPESLTQLKELVGKDSFQKAVRNHFQDAFQTATTTTAEGLNFNIKTLMKSVGLEGTKRENLEGLKVMLKDSDVSFEQFSDFITVAQAHADTYVPSASQFLQRRLTLGGARSVAAVAGVGAAGVGLTTAPITAIGLLFASRQGSKLITNPKNLELANTMLDFKSPRMAKWQAAMRSLTLMISDKDVSEEDKKGLEAALEEIKTLKPNRRN
jgi:hypothetical protein